MPIRHRLLCAAIALTLLAGCGTPRTITTPKGVREYPTYGVFNEPSKRSPLICYEVSIGNIVWSILLFGTIIAPVYFIGFSLWNPVRAKTTPDDDCSSVG